MSRPKKHIRRAKINQNDHERNTTSDSSRFGKAHNYSTVMNLCQKKEGKKYG